MEDKLSYTGRVTFAGDINDYHVGDKFVSAVCAGTIVKVEANGDSVTVYYKSPGYESAVSAYYNGKASGDYTGD